MFDKIKRAFKWHWNLLAVGAGVAFAFFSGQPDVLLPAIAAGELAYLSFLGTNPRFQKVLIGKGMLEEKSAELAVQHAAAQRQVQKMLAFLPPEDAQRFEHLRNRCTRLTQLRNQLGGRDPGEAKLRTGSLEKLLWLFLRLQHQRATIDQYLLGTDRDVLAGQLATAQTELEAARTRGRGEQLIRSLDERVTTIEQRISNYDSSQDNRDLITAEIDKTEQKISHICEVGMTSNSPTELGAQIDSIAESVTISQRALAGLDIDGSLAEVGPDTTGAILPMGESLLEPE